MTMETTKSHIKFTYSENPDIFEKQTDKYNVCTTCATFHRKHRLLLKSECHTISKDEGHSQTLSNANLNLLEKKIRMGKTDTEKQLQSSEP